MNEIEIVSANDQTLPAIAGKILQSKHIYETIYGGSLKCENCGCFKSGHKPKFCTIPLTWPEAMKCRDWAIKKVGKKKFYTTVLKIWKNEKKGRTFSEWLLYYLKAIHYIKAACLCAEKGDSDE